MRFIKRLRPHSRRGAVATLGVLLVGCCGVAFAYYVLTGGSGSGSATLGNAGTGGQLQLTVSFANGLMPGGSEPVNVIVKNPTTSSTYALNAITVSPTVVTSDPTNCKSSWFTFTPNASNSTGIGVTLVPGQSFNDVSNFGAAGVGTIAFVDSGTDQSVCEGDTVTLNATAS
jgi:hypothetical protein